MYDGIGKALEGAFIVFLLAGIAIGGLLFWLLPLLWSWIKPWIHALTG